MISIPTILVIRCYFHLWNFTCLSSLSLKRGPVRSGRQEWNWGANDGAGKLGIIFLCFGVRGQFHLFTVILQLDREMSGRVLQVHEAVCRDSDEEVAMNPRSGGEVVDMNEGSHESRIHELGKKLSEQVVYSEEEAYMLYCDYAQAMGFNVRRGKQYYFMGTRRVRSKTYCCSKEGVKDDKADANGLGYKKVETRTGCKATISFLCDGSGQWKVSRFEKEHNHEMATPYVKPSKKSGQAILASNAYGSGGALDSLSEAEKIRELSLQLVNANNRAETFERQAATYKRQLDMICEHIEEHNHSLSKKIQTALNNVKKLESRD